MKKTLYVPVLLSSVHTVRFALRATAILYMRFYKIVHTLQWISMQLVMYLHWNHKLQAHIIGMEPIHV